MNTGKLKSFAPEARRALLEAVQAKALRLGVAKGKDPVPATVQGDIAIIAGAPYPRATLSLRDKLVEKIKNHGNERFDAVMEEAAYTWFNRLMAIRYMEVHGYFAHGLRVLSDPAGGPVPEVLQQAQNVEIPGLDKARVTKLLLEGGKQEELFQTLLLAQSKALGQAMPFLFDTIDSSTELLLPDNLLAPNSIVRRLVGEIPEDDWRTTEILGWLYQFYVSDEKARVDAYVKRGQAVQVEDIPAKTQLFTPNWIVQFLTQNSLGRLWMDVYTESPLREKMPYYTPPAEQEPEVAAKLREITPDSLDPNTLTAIDPAAGSGHILLELYNLFFAMYQEQGYMPQDIPRRILEQNLFGLELDRRAAQIAGFAVLMRARADDPRLLENPPTVNVVAIQHSRDLDLATLLTPQQAEDLFPSERLIEGDQPKLTVSGRALFADGAMVKAIKELFHEADVVGSLQRIPEELAAELGAFADKVERVRQKANLLENEQLALLAGLVRQAQVLAKRYTACVANPPYLGGKAMVVELKEFARAEYPETKSDLFAMFIERGFDYAEPHGFNAMVTMQSWMFLSSYEKFRQDLVENRVIESMAHLGARGFRELAGEVVQTTATVFRNHRVPQFKGVFHRVIEGDEDAKSAAIRSQSACHDGIAQSEFKKIPGWPIAYWLNQEVRNIFERGKTLADLTRARSGMSSCDSALFLRNWYEVNINRIKRDSTNLKDAASSGAIWFPYNKGGGFSRWYGFNEVVIRWESDGAKIKDYVINNPRDPNTTHWSRRLFNLDLFFKPALTWSALSSDGFSCRIHSYGVIPGTGSKTCLEPEGVSLNLLVAWLNCSTVEGFMEFLCPTLNFEGGDVERVPFPVLSDQHVTNISSSASRAVNLARLLWNSSEPSWDFDLGLLLPASLSASEAFHESASIAQRNEDELRRIEDQLNRTFAEAYGEDGEGALHRRIDDSRVPSKGQWTRGIASVYIGCGMGRYSLDEPGLIYAHAGGEGFDPSRYRTFPADEDGILPLTDQAFFGDQDTAERFAQWVQAVWPNSPLEENLAFIAENLGKKPDETPLEAIRRYLNEDFYADHLQTYKKRPIYWLFSSGKKRAFQALVYLHRYHPGTLGRMRSHYVQPLIGKLQAQLQQAEASADAASSASEKARRQREAKKLREQYDELLGFDERLHHYALQGIALDLDDGVKVNYGKFSDPTVGDILAKVKDITGGKND